MTSGLRYKFQGSVLAVEKGSGTVVNITAATKAVECVLTIAAGTPVVGDVLTLAAVVGMTELNGQRVVVKSVAGTAVTLFGIDSTGYTTYTSGGTATPAVFGTFCELTGIDRSGGASADIPASTICSDAEESEVGLRSFGVLKLDFNYAPTALVQVALQAAQAAGTPIAVKRVMPKAAGTTIWQGLVLETGEGAQVNDLWKGSASIKLTGSAFNY